MFLNLQGKLKYRVARVNSAETNCAFFMREHKSLQSLRRLFIKGACVW